MTLYQIGRKYIGENNITGKNIEGKKRFIKGL